MIGISTRGKDRTTNALKKMMGGALYRDLDRYGQMGVSALSQATPTDSGLSGMSWAYRVVRQGKWVGVEWYNTNVVNGVPVVILIQYGHGTGTGGYVQGRDFINPAMQPIFDQIADEIWRRVVTDS